MWNQYYGLIPGFTQQRFNCLLSLFTTQAGKEKWVCFPSSTMQRRSREDLAVQKLSGSFGTIKELWGISTHSASSAHCSVSHKEAISSFLQCIQPWDKVTFGPYPLEVHQNSPVIFNQVWVAPRDHFLKIHLAFGKVQHVRMWGVCSCSVDLYKCVCCINNRDIHTCNFQLPELEGRRAVAGFISTQMADSSPSPGPANQLMKFWHLGKGQTFQNHTLLWLLKDDFPTHMKEDNMPEAKLGYRHVKCEAYDTFMSQTPLTSWFLSQKGSILFHT